jgi:uncharacterized protein YqjF (DUF2071 family)
MTTSAQAPRAPSLEARIGATKSPGGLTLMRHRWAHLLFLHWAVPVEELRPLVPRELDIDTFEGQAYVGLIPFTMTGVRLSGFPAVPWCSRAHEVNVRTYVHRQGDDPGVWFFSLDVNHRLAYWGARRFFHLPYQYARIQMKKTDGAASRIDYDSERLGPGPRPATCRLSYEVQGVPSPVAPGTLDHFLIERYILYAQKETKLYLGRVHHEPYPVQGARLLAMEESLLNAAGIDRPSTPPLVHYAEEVRVRVDPIYQIKI